MVAAIEVRGLTKTYTKRGQPPVDAVRGVDLQVEEGEIVAFLGANGAGKTTVIEILEGFRDRTAGEVEVLGVDPASAPLSWRENIGIVLQESEPDSDLTARESLELYRAFYQDRRSVDEVLEIVGLVDAADQRTTKLSGGQQRRLDLATALIGNPTLLFLDEPTTGFDPSARREAWGMVERLRQIGATVLLTTHYMDEAENLSDRIVVINEGLIIANGTAGELAHQVASQTTITWRIDEVPVQALPAGLAQGVSVIEGLATIESEDVAAVVGALAKHATAAGLALGSLQVTRPNLEDTFLRLTADDADPT